VVQPEKIRSNAEFRAQLEAIDPEAIVVVAYGRIIPPWMLTLPRLGCINLHGSLLPKYRGAAPIQWAVAMGDAFTGNTTMLLEEGLDTGPILLQQTVEVGPNQTAVELFDILARAGAPLVVETLAGLADGTIKAEPQNHEGATFAPLLDREDGRMDFAARTATELYNRWRGFQPWPGAFTTLDGKKLIVHRMAIADASNISAPGSTKAGQIHVEHHRLLAACGGETWLELVEVQLEGKKRLAAAEFLHGTPLAENARLG
jgi:methionyl-tRNA formyltransferase